MDSKDKNIILEKYDMPIIGWNPKVCAKELAKTLEKRLTNSKLCLQQLDGKLVPSDFFSFKNVLAEKPIIETKEGDTGDDKKGSGFSISVKFMYELKGEEKINFIYGKSDNNDVGGIIWNTNFRSILENTDNESGFDPRLDENKPPEEKNEEENEEETTSESILNKYKNAYNAILIEEDDENSKTADSSVEAENKRLERLEKAEAPLTIWLTFFFNEFTNIFDTKGGSEQEKDRPKNKFNPNYIVNMKGSIFLSFGEEENTHNQTKIGTITYRPSRTKNMDPKDKPFEDLSQSIEKLWNAKPPQGSLTVPDNDLASIAVSWAAKKAVTGAIDIFKKVQKESVSIIIEKKYQQSNNHIGGKPSVSQMMEANADTEDAETRNMMLNLFKDKIQENVIDKEVNEDKKKIGIEILAGLEIKKCTLTDFKIEIKNENYAKGEEKNVLPFISLKGEFK